jgi:2-polyprenyl-3-methyl-5-hydroxy-6-metoxy-1,4-benzoquinol methylase
VNNISCDLCKDDNIQILYKSQDYRLNVDDKIYFLVYCNNCNILFINPKPKPEEISTHYPEKFFQANFNISNLYIRLLNKIKIRIITRYKKSGRILDIGCGDGEFLLNFKKKGWNTYGIDTSPLAYSLSKNKIIKNIFNTTLTECRFGDNFFDVITLNNVIEHVDDPEHLIKEIFRILKKEGILFILTPNIESYQCKITKQYWIHLDIPRHLYLYSPKSLATLLEKHFFTVIGVSFPVFENPLDIYHSLKRQHNLKFFSGIFLLFILLKIFPKYRSLFQIVCSKHIT